jgi:hypothetical protein
MITIVGSVLAKIYDMECILAFLWLPNTDSDVFYNHAAKIMLATMFARKSIGAEDKNLVSWGYHEKLFVTA